MSDRRTYNQKYYDEKKKKINERHRQKYANDPIYREKAKLSSLERYKMNRKFKLPSDRTVVTDAEGTSLLFTIGKLAKALDKSVFTVRYYHRKDIVGDDGEFIHKQVIPDPTHYDGRGWRLYTAYQFKLIVEVFNRFERTRMKRLRAGEEPLETLSDVADKLFKHWR